MNSCDSKMWNRSVELARCGLCPTLAGLLVMLGCAHDTKPESPSVKHIASGSLSDTKPSQGSATNQTAPGVGQGPELPSTATPQQLQAASSVEDLGTKRGDPSGSELLLIGYVTNLYTCPDCFEVEGQAVCGEPCMDLASLVDQLPEGTPADGSDADSADVAVPVRGQPTADVALFVEGSLKGWFEEGRRYVIRGSVAQWHPSEDKTIADFEAKERWLAP